MYAPGITELVHLVANCSANSSVMVVASNMLTHSYEQCCSDIKLMNRKEKQQKRQREKERKKGKTIAWIAQIYLNSSLLSFPLA